LNGEDQNLRKDLPILPYFLNFSDISLIRKLKPFRK
ncbi:MAG: hypothetical protein ACI9U0_001856, partial [Flavobacteriales bacterium]